MKHFSAASRQIKSDVTVCVLSCDRVDLLLRTMASFQAHNDMDRFKFIICDDSPSEACHQTILEKYQDLATMVIWGQRRGPGWCWDMMFNLADTPWLIQLEDDWESLAPFPLKECQDVMGHDRRVGSFHLWKTLAELEAENARCKIPALVPETPWEITPGGTRYKRMGTQKPNDVIYKWHPYYEQPSLIRRYDWIRIGLRQYAHSSWVYSNLYKTRGFYGATLGTKYFEHIGWRRSVYDKFGYQNEPEKKIPSTAANATNLS